MIRAVATFDFNLLTENIKAIESSPGLEKLNRQKELLLKFLSANNTNEIDFSSFTLEEVRELMDNAEGLSGNISEPMLLAIKTFSIKRNRIGVLI